MKAIRTLFTLALAVFASAAFAQTEQEPSPIYVYTVGRVGGDMMMTEVIEAMSTDENATIVQRLKMEQPGSARMKAVEVVRFRTRDEAQEDLDNLKSKYAKIGTRVMMATDPRP